jgi:hypothetical protein
MRKIFIPLFTVVLFFFVVLGVQAQDNTLHNKTIDSETIDLHFFWGVGCPHCAKEELFLEKMEARYPELTVNKYEIWGSAENRSFMKELAENLNAQVSGVPFTVIGNNYFIGWADEKNTGTQIEQAIISAINANARYADTQISNIHTETTPPTNEGKDPSQNTPPTNGEEDSLEGVASTKQGDKLPETLTLPIIGQIETKNLSLPILTIIIGGLDGFNPCAMWTLLFLISILLGMHDRRRMWILGTTFIVASASVYFLFLSAWLNLLLFIGFILWVRIIIGLVALGGGGYYLKEYFFNPHSTCKVTGTDKRRKVFEKIKKLTHEQNFWIAFFGIILLAAAVNLVELVCSAGLPAVYTQILTLNSLPTWQYYGYLLLYIFVFMLDDLLVFILAMTTLKMTGISDKYSRISHLIGGIAMVIIGLLLLFKPEWLMFG